MRPVARLIMAVVGLGALVHATEARAQEVFHHVVHDGETLASIAQQYYGNARREAVLVTENGLITEGGSDIVSGMRLVIPWVTYHRVAQGETWNSLSSKFYGDARRAFLLIEVNKASSRGQPSVGAEILIPYPLRYVADQNDSLRHVAQLFYDGSKNGLRVVTRFNPARGTKLARGQVVLVPLGDLVLSKEGREHVEVVLGRSIEGGERRALQQWAGQEIPKLVALGKSGQYAECVSLGNRLLGTQQLEATQVVTVQRELGHSYVALGRPDLAAAAFVEALRLQPDLTLSAIETSPTVFRAFEAAQAMLAKEQQGAAKTPPKPAAKAQ